MNMNIYRAIRRGPGHIPVVYCYSLRSELYVPRFKESLMYRKNQSDSRFGTERVHIRSRVGFRFVDGPRIAMLCRYAHVLLRQVQSGRPVDHLFPATGTWIYTYRLMCSFLYNGFMHPQNGKR